MSDDRQEPPAGEHDDDRTRPLPSAADRPAPTGPAADGPDETAPIDRHPARPDPDETTPIDRTARLVPTCRPTRPCRSTGPPARGRVRRPTGRRRYRRRGPVGPRCARPDRMTPAVSGTSRSRVVGGGGCRSSGAYWRCCSPP